MPSNESQSGACYRGGQLIMLQLKNLLGVASYFQDKLDQLLRLALPKSVHRLVLRCFLH